MFLQLVGIFLCVQVALAQLPAGVDEQTLYQAVYPLDQYAQGYGNNNGGSGQVERIDNQPVTQPEQQETRQGQDQVLDHQLQDEQRQARVDQTKEIHNYQTQKRIVNVNNRILHRYLKNLLVNVIYNTNIQRVNHQKLINLLLTTLQETHQPKLLVKYSRQDTTNDLGERQEQPEISEDRQDRQLPPVFVPATVEKIGYDGLGLGSAVSAGSGGFSSGGSGFSSGGSSSGRFSSGSSSLGSSGSSSGGFSSGGFSSGVASSGGFSNGHGGGHHSGFSSGGSSGLHGGHSLGSGSSSGSVGHSAGFSSGGSSHGSGNYQSRSESSLSGGSAIGGDSSVDVSALLSGLVGTGGAGLDLSAGSGTVTRK